MDPDALAFLAANNQVFLFATLADGSPMGWPMVGRLNDGGMEFSTYRKSAKVRDVLRNDTASCLVVPREGDADGRTLMVTGAVSLREDHGGADAVKAAAGSGRSGIDVPKEIVESVRSRHDSGKRCILRIELDELRFGALPTSTGSS
ncbi:MAG: pyridoxamine 5'-phosphate oxidase family protein [Ilumatobacteraceae bacterium]